MSYLLGRVYTFRGDCDDEEAERSAAECETAYMIMHAS